MSRDEKFEGQRKLHQGTKVMSRGEREERTEHPIHHRGASKGSSMGIRAKVGSLKGMYEETGRMAGEKEA